MTKEMVHYMTQLVNILLTDESLDQETKQNLRNFVQNLEDDFVHWLGG